MEHPKKDYEKRGGRLASTLALPLAGCALRVSVNAVLQSPKDFLLFFIYLLIFSPAPDVASILGDQQ